MIHAHRFADRLRAFGVPAAVGVHAWLAGPVPADVERSLARVAAADDVRAVAVLPDVHLARGVCVGTVVATHRLLYPAAVGGDIGCGMAAVALDCDADLLAGESTAGRLLAALHVAAPPDRHRRPRPLPARLAAISFSRPDLDRLKRRDAGLQLGTLGGGNHFLEFQADDSGRLWLMVHTGSRAVGQAVRDAHAPPTGRPAHVLQGLDAELPAGQAYLNDAAWAAAYADENRRALVEGALASMKTLFGVRPVDGSYFTCDHNHVRRETHGGAAAWVHRKGANSAADGEAGIIPGSMGAYSFHVAGRGVAESLRSSSHGAGRAMSRQEARRRVGVRQLEKELRAVAYDRCLAPALCEEAPSAYKDVRAVIRAQSDLIRVVRRLRPVLCYKGG